MKNNDLEKVFKKKKTSAEKIAHQVGMTPPGFRKAIREQSMKLSVFIAMCKALKVHPMYFLIPGARFEDFDNLSFTDHLPDSKEEIRVLKQSNDKLKDKLINLNDKLVEQTDKFLELLESKK